MLIQKDVKRIIPFLSGFSRLRALLIQKDVKPEVNRMKLIQRLRALLIQKDVKLNSFPYTITRRFESFVNSERCKTL